MMEFQEFERYINIIKDIDDFQNKVCSIFGCEPIESVCLGDDAIIDLLALHFEDESEWISYWIYELNFGKDYHDGAVTMDDEIVKMATVEDLYNVLKENKEKNNG